jgi:hypothetical protein
MVPWAWLLLVWFPSRNSRWYNLMQNNEKKNMPQILMWNIAWWSQLSKELTTASPETSIWGPPPRAAWATIRGSSSMLDAKVWLWDMRLRDHLIAWHSIWRSICRANAPGGGWMQQVFFSLRTLPRCDQALGLKTEQENPVPSRSCFHFWTVRFCILRKKAGIGRETGAASRDRDRKQLRLLPDRIYSILFWARIFPYFIPLWGFRISAHDLAQSAQSES